jgi:hypothetical protein
MSSGAEVTRRFVPPLGWPFGFRIGTITPAARPRFITANRYPRQVIGFAVRLPSEETASGQIRHKQLSLLWAKPARWWVDPPVEPSKEPQTRQRRRIGP